MIDGRTCFDQPVNNDLRTYDNIPKVAMVDVMIAQLDVY